MVTGITYWQNIRHYNIYNPDIYFMATTLFGHVLFFHLFCCWSIMLNPSQFSWPTQIFNQNQLDIVATSKFVGTPWTIFFPRNKIAGNNNQTTKTILEDCVFRKKIMQGRFLLRWSCSDTLAMSGDSSSVQEQLFDVSEVFASEDAFAALKGNGTVS